MLSVLEEKGVREYLVKRNILEQYKKVKANLVQERYHQVNLKKRKPKMLGVYQFRITKKYRAFGYFRSSDVFIVTEISYHQL